MAVVKDIGDNDNDINNKNDINKNNCEPPA